MKLKWSNVKSVGSYDWNKALEEAKNYSEEPDKSDKGFWRLPTMKELQEHAKSLDYKNLAVWTSNEGLSCAVICYLEDGSVSDMFKENLMPTIFVREIEEPKLEWQSNPPDNLMTWDEAMSYAKSLGDGWRLPTIEELKYAYNNVQGFQSSYYWSSSTYAQDINDAWGVNFSYGYVNYGSKADSLYVRCVRDIPKETVREPFWEIRDCLRVQEKSALLDEYNLGLYNGMEFCLAILEKREPKYKDMEPKKPIIPRYRIDVLQSSDKEIKGMKYELQEDGNWIQYNDIRNLIDNYEYLLFELKKLLRDVK